MLATWTAVKGALPHEAIFTHFYSFNNRLRRCYRMPILSFRCFPSFSDFRHLIIWVVLMCVLPVLRKLKWHFVLQVGCFDPYSDDPRLGIQKIHLCKYSGYLTVAGTAGQVRCSLKSWDGIMALYCQLSACLCMSWFSLLCGRDGEVMSSLSLWPI